MSKETKIIVVLLAIYLFWHWRNLQTALATGLTGSAGNATPGFNSTGGAQTDYSAGNGAIHGTSFRETWGTYE